MKIIDFQIQAALRKLKAVCRSNAEMGRRLGVSRAQIGKYLSGATGYFDDATWRRISPVLSPYIGEISNCPFRQDNHCRLTGQNPDMIRLIELISAMSELERAELLVTVLKQAAPQKENQ